MSVTALGSKRALYDIWPLKNKKFFVLVDPHNILGATTDSHATVNTIDYLIKKKGAVVVGASFGALCGIPLNLPRQEREEAIEAFRREEGMGLSNFFSSLSPQAKLEVLRGVPGFEVPSTCSVDCDTGKTRAFSRLENAAKFDALRRVFPKAEFSPVSTLPFVKALSKLLPGVKVTFARDCLRPPLHQLSPGDVLVLENLQFYSNETSSDPAKRRAMAEVLAAGIDVFVNESFSTASKEHASNTALPKLLQHGAAGLSMDRELAFFSKFLTHPARPIAVVVAGTHVPEKLLLIRSLIGKVDKILIAGALAIPFLSAKGLTCGKSLNLCEVVKRTQLKSRGGNIVEESVPCTQLADEIISLCEANGTELVLPVDHVVSKELTNSKETVAVVVESMAVPSDVYAMDCGASTISLFAKYIRACQCVYWTGTFGWTNLGYNAGTHAFATLLAQERKLSIIGGRSTASAVQKFELAPYFSHISGGGVSCLEVLQGHLLPGVEALSDVTPGLDSKSTVSVDELLRNLPLFSGCTSHQIQAAARKFARRLHACGDYLAYRGDRHVSMWVVAEGGLVARLGDNTLTIPSRFIGRGQTVGMYDFITQAFAVETVQAAVSGTITYQLTSSSLNDLLNEHPDLAAQFLQNVSEPLSMMATEEYQNQASLRCVLRRAAVCSRVPGPYAVPEEWGLIEDIVQDVVSALALQKLTMQYTDYPALSPMQQDNYLWGKLACHGGLLPVLGAAVLRDVAYHRAVSLGLMYATIRSALVTAPLRLMAMGRNWSGLTYRAVLDEALASVAVSWVPLAAHASFLAMQRRLELLKRSRCTRFVQLLIMVVVRLFLGFIVFALLFRRNRDAESTSLLGLFRTDAFKAYELKQAISVLLRFGVHLLLGVVWRAHAHVVSRRHRRQLDDRK
ncbi:3-phosphoglycerate kinase, glycosomal [Trypanosoma conorhini]|uniref:Phosphoglycerate kinase n=1 Tax=Trypanosoma conorhini TaxID=83891 RepID=A0A3R7P5X9_9TRYP|nr:3-phosphoglycerate kinase, glycosomal [Trypanosoma conorhini]RNF17963.1 3-phosphoglycerate kinase, glycosomal [Trypanosoma conorhini]